MTLKPACYVQYVVAIVMHTHVMHSGWKVGKAAGASNMPCVCSQSTRECLAIVCGWARY